MRAWKIEALCANIDDGFLDLFFPGRGEATDPRVLELCAACTVTEECLEYSLEKRITFDGSGIWGGTNPTERRRIVRLRSKERTSC